MSAEELVAKRDVAIQALKALERRINETAQRIQMLDQERASMQQRQQQFLTDMLSTRAYVSGMNIALGDPPLPESVSTGLLVSQGLANTGITS
jgi:ubiquinone biosynthesis protein COQ9